MALNRIYKVVWSKTKGCYVVVSELAKRVGRNKAKAIVISSAAMAMAVSPILTSTVGAVNTPGTGRDNAVALGQESKVEDNNGVAIGKKAQSTKDSAIALGFESKSTGDQSVAIGLQTKATNEQAVAVGSKSQATGKNSIAIGNEVNASNEFSVALGSKTQSTNKYTTAVGATASASQEGATALGYKASATAKDTIAIGNSAKAEQEGVLALGSASFAQGKNTIAIGDSATAKKEGDIIIGKDAKSRDQGGGFSVAIGLRATAGNTASNAETDDTTTEIRKDSGSVAIGTNAYTGLNRNNTAVNSSVAIGAGAGVGYRSVRAADGTPLGVGTDPDTNAKVLVKAFGGTTNTLDYFNNAGAASKDAFFSFQGVDINEGVALGRNTRAIGDQSVAIGAQSIAGMGSIVIGGNDIQAYDQKKYFKAKNPTSGDARGVNDYDAEVTPGTGKNGQPITITAKYKELVGAELDRSYRASYGQDGSTVIGMQAHSTTPLGVAIGTNSIVRKGAFGATAIGSGASVVANAEAAVAIGMGAEAQGNYAVAAGTAARAKESAVAAGYTANAEVNAVAVGNKSVSKASAVAVGDESEATNSSVAVGQLAKAEKTADIAVGQGAVASGEQGAIAMGLGTQAQGDSSIMIGGSEINKVANQRVTYQKEKKDAQGRTVIKSTETTETVGGEQVKRTIRSVETEEATGSIQEAYMELTNKRTLDTATLNYSLPANKNGHGSISMGVHSLSTGDLGTAIGTGARVTKLGGVALGTGAISELQNGVAIGTGSRADKNSIGTRQTDISYDKEGKIVPFDSKKVAYTFYWAGGTNTSEGDVVSFGSPGAERQLKNVAAGRIADDSTDAINGSQLNSVTKRMSSGWAVEAEKDHGSSGVLKLNGAEATGQSVTYAADGKSSTKGDAGTATGQVDKVRLNDEVKIRVGNNLILNQEDSSRKIYEDPDNPTRQTGTRVTSKFTYSLNPELTGLKSAQFKNDTGDTTTINGAGVTVTPVTAGKQAVSLTTTGLNNGGNAISNVAGNLPETKNNDATTGASNATTSQAAPTLGNAANQVNPTNAATVSDVLNAGWNLQGDGAAVDFVKPYDTVNFVKGDGTSVTVDSKDGKTSTVKYSVNLGEGLKKDDNNNITVKAADKSLTVGTDGVKVNPGDKSLKTTEAGLTVNTADKSLEVTNDGLKVKAGDKTLTTDANGLKVNTGDIEPVTTGTNPGTVKVKDGDTGKVATVDSVVNAVNNAAWTATSAATSAGELGATPTDQSVKAGDKVTFEADKNIKITQAGSKFTFTTKNDVSFNTVQVGGDQGPKLSKTDAGDLKVSGPNGTDPVKVTNVKDGEISADSKDAINGSQFHKLANNTIQLKGQTGDNAATETNKQELNKKDGIAFTVKSSDGSLLEVSAEGDTITLTPKTGTITTTDGVPTATTTNGKLITADQVVNALKEMGWKAIADKDGSGTVDGAAATLVKAGETVTFKAGDNLAVKQDGKNFIYSLQKELTGLTSAEFKNQAGDKTVINNDGVTITPATNGKQPVSLTKDGLNNGGNPITNVTSNLVNYTEPEVNGVQPAKNSLRNLDDNSVANTNAATVGDLRNMGWIVSSDKTTGANGTTTATAYSEAVKNANEVRFVGEGSAIVSGKTEGNVRTITVKVDSQTGLNKTVTPVNYTKADGTKVYPQEVDNGDGTKKVKFFENPDGTGKEIPSTEVITSVNGPKGTTTPATLSNVKSNLPDTKNSDTANTADAPSNATKSQAAPNTTDKAGNTYVNPNNAATVSDVLNAGWNLQGNGTEVDFVKAYDTVNFIDGEGTTATVASTDGKTSTVKYSVNLGKGLQKDDTGNTISVKPADSSLVVDDAGVKVNTGTINNVTTGDKPGTVEANNGDENKVATVGNVVNAINNAAWTATSAKTNDGELGKEATNQLVKSGDKVTFEADKNIKITQDGSKFTFTTKNDVSFDTVQVGGEQGPKLSKTDNGDLKVSGPNGTSPVKVTNVTSGLDTYGDNVPGTTDKNRGLVDLSKPENGQPKVSDNTAATVGDLRNMGWIVSADKKTGDLTNAYSDTVKNANEVKFVGEGTAIVSGKTEGDVRTITVKVDDQTSTNNAVTPVVYTDKDGNQVYPTGKKDQDGNQIFNTKPDGKGADVTGPVKTTINGPKGTTSPTSLSNVKNNIPAVNDADKKVTNADGTDKPDAGNVANINKAPLTAEEAADLLKPTTKDAKPNPNFVGNNAATVSDVLNAGWNLQNNGTAKDFVKPYDTVNFVDGGNTTAVVTTNAAGTASDVTFNVTGLPVTNTITENGKEVPVVKVGNTFYPAKPDGTPDIQKGQDGNPTNGYVQADNGKVYPRDAVTITKNQDGTTTVTPNTDATPKTVNTNLVNPNVANTTDKPGNNVSTPNQLGNVANGAKTFEPVDGKVLANDGKWYPADKVSDKGTPEAGAKAVENPLAPKNAAGEALVQAKDGKWYKPSDLQPNGTPTPTAQPQDNVINNKAGLVDFSNSNPNNAATIGDLQNMGWVVSAQGNSYSDQVRNTNEVKFVGEGTASVTGKTDDKGVRTITVKVDDQVSTNNSVTPVVYTDKAGNTVYPIKDDKGNVTYHTTPDGKGENDKVVPNGDVNTSINGPKDDQGNTRPASLSNVKNNIPAVNDADKKVTNADGTDKPDAGNVANINKAPLTAEEAADLLKPTTKDGKPNPNFVGNNAATVSDVLNAGWNLQNNGTAKDFVKPFDTVNFVNGVNTTAVVTTSEDGTTSNVTYNVTGLPVTYTTADGTPVSKIGDKYYKVNEQGQPLDSNGKPATKINENGVPVGEDGQPISEVNITDTPLTSKLVNPNAKNTDAEPNKKTTDPTQLGNVTSGLQKYGDTVDGKEVPGSTKANNGLVDLSTPTDGVKPKVSDNTAATVGDLRNMGWIVSSDKTTGETDKAYTDTVKNANEVKFVGEGTAIVSGKTDGNVRTITVKVDDQTSTNNSVTPVNYTKADGTKVYPKTVTDPKTGKEEVKFFENPDGSGAEVPKGDVVTSINGPEGTTSPTTLKNVKNNIPNVNDGSKTITNPDGTEKTGDVENINKAPLTAEEAAALANPKTKDGQTNPKYIGNNAATVSDVLNAGWNLQNNGAARDFVKPFDTVNFVNGVNTTAVVTTSEDGTTSNVTYNVTGLPVTYTTADGTPVSKIGDDYYTVNDKGQPIDANGKPSTKVNKDGKPVDENGNVIKPIDTTANPLTSSLVNPNVKNTDAEPNKKTTDPTQLGNVTSGLQKYGDTVDGKEVPGSTKANNGLVDLSTPTDGSKPKVSDNTAATVGDLRNMGWIVSSDKTTGETDKAYTDTVKNANEVKFVGEGTAIVSGKTDDKGVRTITVKVDDQVSTNNSVTPVNYTKADGTKVYPKAVRDPKTGKEEVKFFENPDGSGAEVPKGDVVTSINGPEGTTSPTTLKNVKNNIPNVNDGSKTITNPDGTEKTGDVENINKAPLTAEEAAALANPKTKDGQANPKYIGNNAATVSDVLNAGWNLQNNGESRDFVKPYDIVNFVNGLGTTAVVTTREGNTASDVTFNVKAANGSVTVDENGVKVTTGEMKPAVGTDNKETGAIATPADPATAKQLKETLSAAEKDLSAARAALKEAEKALAADPKDPALQQAVADKKADVAAKQTPVDAAQKAHDEAGLNKVATVQNVAEAINNAGFNLKTSADGGEKLTGTKDDGELIKPSNTVEMVAGNNLTVKQDANGKITYATKDNVTFTNVDTGTLNVGSPNTYTDGKGNTYTKVGDHYYKPADVVNGAPKPGATPVDVTTTPVTPVSPVTMKAEAAKPATNNASDAQPSSALNVTSKDGKPTQITGVGSTLNTKSVDTTPAGTAPETTPNTTPANLVDLEGTADAPVNKNAAATVGDLQNMGWVVSAKDGNGYKDVVKNANVVDFKGGKGIEITGKTLTDGTREITVGIKEGEVTNKVTITHADGSKTEAIKIGDNYYKVGKDGKPEGYEKGKDGKPAGTPLTVDPKNDKVTNTGAGFVTGNTVANAIQESGWNVGIGSTDKDYSKDAKVYDKVNPNDDVKFANGANTNVSMVTVDAINEDGTKKATTFVKVDVNRDLKIDSVTTGGTAVDKNGNNLVKVGDDYYKESDIDPVTKQPKANAKPVPKADVTPAKDGAMIVKNADGKDVVSATVGKDGSGEFGVKGKDGKDGISMTAKDGQGTIGVNGKDGATTTIKGDTITIKDKEGNTNTSTPTSNELKDTKGNTNTSTADKIELKDKDGNTNTSTPTTNVLKDTNGNTNTSTGAGTTYKDKDDNTAVVGPKEIALTDKSGDNKASFTNKDLIFNAKDPKNGVEKTSHVSGDKIAFTTTDEMEKVFDKDGKPVIDPTTGKQKEVVKMEKVFDKDGKPVIDPTTGKQKEVIKNPGNSTEYTNEGLKVIPNSTVARDANGNLTYVDKDNKPVMKDKDGNFVYMGKDGKPGEKYAGAVGALKPNVVDNTRVISFGMDKPVLDEKGNPVTGPDGNPLMTEGISAGMQQMHNLAPGTKDTDAVNVSQLRGTTININNRINRSGAQAAALAGLQTIQYDPLEPTQVSAGLGYYQGASALALGVNHYKNESTLFHLGASFNGYGSEVMANASVTWKFGARADETAVKDTFRQGPISASYTLQDKVSALEAQNQIQKDQLNELRATNAAQKAENEAQREEMALMKAQIAELFKRLNG